MFERKRTIQQLRVPLGFLCGAFFLVVAAPTFFTLPIGASVAMIGLLVRAWASGHIRKNQKLAISGPYAYTRNPLYLGSFLMVLGLMIVGASWILATLFVVLFLAIYLPVMRVEAEELREIFGADFRRYEKNVPLFFPRFTPLREAKKIKFDFALYRRYREYQAALGLVFVIGILIAKAVWWR